MGCSLMFLRICSQLVCYTWDLGLCHVAFTTQKKKVATPLAWVHSLDPTWNIMELDGLAPK